MSPFRFLFPSFEKPVARQPYINLERPRRRLSGVGIALGVSVLFGSALALPQILQLPKGQQQFDAPSPAKTEAAASGETATISSAAAAAAYADAAQPSVKLSALCAEKPTARRACAQAQAAKEALLSGSLARADAAPAVQQPTTQQQAASGPKPKAKTVRSGDEVPGAPVERLVRVYDQVMPDGRRVPVYRRADGSLEVGTVTDGEYRPSRSAELAPPAGRGFFGLQ